MARDVDLDPHLKVRCFLACLLMLVVVASIGAFFYCTVYSQFYVDHWTVIAVIYSILLYLPVISLLVHQFFGGAIKQSVCRDSVDAADRHPNQLPEHHVAEEGSETALLDPEEQTTCCCFGNCCKWSFFRVLTFRNLVTLLMYFYLVANMVVIFSSFFFDADILGGTLTKNATEFNETRLMLKEIRHDLLWNGYFCTLMVLLFAVFLFFDSFFLGPPKSVKNRFEVSGFLGRNVTFTLKGVFEKVRDRVQVDCLLDRSDLENMVDLKGSLALTTTDVTVAVNGSLKVDLNPFKAASTEAVEGGLRAAVAGSLGDSLHITCPGVVEAHVQVDGGGGGGVNGLWRVENAQGAVVAEEDRISGICRVRNTPVPMLFMRATEDLKEALVEIVDRLSKTDTDIHPALLALTVGVSVPTVVGLDYLLFHHRDKLAEHSDSFRMTFLRFLYTLTFLSVGFNSCVKILYRSVIHQARKKVKATVLLVVYALFVGAVFASKEEFNTKDCCPGFEWSQEGLFFLFFFLSKVSLIASLFLHDPWPSIKRSLSTIFPCFLRHADYDDFSGGGGEDNVEVRKKTYPHYSPLHFAVIAVLVFLNNWAFNVFVTWYELFAPLEEQFASVELVLSSALVLCFINHYYEDNPNQRSVTFLIIEMIRKFYVSKNMTSAINLILFLGLLVASTVFWWFKYYEGVADNALFFKLNVFAYLANAVNCLVMIVVFIYDSVANSPATEAHGRGQGRGARRPQKGAVSKCMIITFSLCLVVLVIASAFLLTIWFREM